MRTKSIIFLGTNATTTTGYAVTEAVNLGDWEAGYHKMNVLLNVGTLTGGGTIIASVQERFSGAGFIETARSGVISATGSYWITHNSATGTLVGGQYGSYPALGSGTEKRIVFTSSALASLGVDNYLVFFND